MPNWGKFNQKLATKWCHHSCRLPTFVWHCLPLPRTWLLVVAADNMVIVVGLIVIAIIAGVAGAHEHG